MENFFRLGDEHCNNEFDEEEVQSPNRAGPEARMISCGGPRQHVPEIAWMKLVEMERVRALLVICHAMQPMSQTIIMSSLFRSHLHSREIIGICFLLAPEADEGTQAKLRANLTF